MAYKESVVLCHGVFDVLHIGHIKYLEAAKKHGNWLVVSITSDKHVNKGPGRPYFNEKLRKEMLLNLKIVDHVLINDYPSAVPIINQIKPSFYIKGSDYKDLEKDVTGKIYQEIEAVESHGGQVIFLNEEMFSSSNIINTVFNQWSDTQKKVINEINGLGGLSLIKDYLKQIEQTLKVVVVGELIWDTYRFVRPEGVSSKSPSISARYCHEERYRGGAWAIRNHIESFCPVTLVTSKVEHEKIRYISAESGQRMFEVTNIKKEDDPLVPHPWPEHNLCIVADFGHGLINKNNLQTDKFRALNVQTNSSNYGFNVFPKHEEWNYLVLDQREIRLAFNDRETSAIDLGFRAHGFNSAPVGLTLGPNGSAFFHEGKCYPCPSFTDNIVDTIGAGDAYLALTSLLVRVGAPPQITNFLGNVFAGLKTKIIGNKASVTKISLIKAVESILK